LIFALLAGCSNSPTPVPAPAPAEPVAIQQAAPEPAEVAPKPVAPVAKPRVNRPSAPPAAPVAAKPAESPRETPVNLPPVADVRDLPPSRPEPTPVFAPPQPPPPPAPPERTIRQVTIPSGTLVAVRMTDSVNSETARVGETFRATLDAPLTVDQESVAPQGTDVYLRLIHVESAGKLMGRSKISLELDRILIGGKSYTVASEVYEKQGESQTQQTAKHTGIGAAIGAAVGAIAGGKKGAIIGAGVGGGAGVAIEATGKSEQVQIDSESRLDFRLEHPLEVTLDSRTISAPSPRDSSGPPRLLRR
jgi:hypothetical protein